MITAQEFLESLARWPITTAADTYREAQLREFIAQSAAYGVVIDYDKLVNRVKRLHGSTMLTVDEAIESITRRLLPLVQIGDAGEVLTVLEESAE